MTQKLYLLPDAPVTAQARVLAIDCSGSTPRVTVDKTVFHVKGGGQLPDRGMIGEANVLDVRHAADGTVDHFVDSADGLSVGQEVCLSVDIATRIQYSLLHTAGHLIAGVLSSPFPTLRPIGAHHYPGECRVEFLTTGVLPTDLRTDLADLLAQAIGKNYSVEVTGDPEVKRLIAIGRYPPIACGGTHIREIADLHRVELTGLKLKDGRLRISYSL